MNHFSYSLHDARGQPVFDVQATVLPRKGDILCFTRGDFLVTSVRIVYELGRDTTLERFIVNTDRL